MKFLTLISALLFSLNTFAGGDSIGGMSLLQASQVEAFVSDPLNLSRNALEMSGGDFFIAEDMLKAYKPYMTEKIIQNSFKSNLIQIDQLELNELTKISIEASYFSNYKK